MKTVIRRALVVTVAILFGAASAAWACPVKGSVVCKGTTTGVPNVVVSFTAEGAPSASGATDATGLFDAYLEWAGVTYSVTLDLGAGVLVSEPAVTCVGDAITLAAYEVEASSCGTPPPPPPPPPSGADCSPGYYKNHVGAWCSPCGFTSVECAWLVQELTAKGTNGSARRDFAKAQIDACFGTAAASPCTDD
jgi:hypothetical protein